MVVLPDLVSQLLETFCGLLLAHCHSARYEQRKLSAKVERVLFNAWRSSFGEADAPFNFPQKRLSIGSDETR
jgi:hypothetical protein